MRISFFSALLAGSQHLSLSARLLTAVAPLALASCSTILDNLPGVYSIGIQQGNIVDQAMINQLRPQMSKKQVLFVMGSPMLEDFFHKNRWTYLYYNKPSGGEVEQKTVSLYFENDQLTNLQGDLKPGNGNVQPTPQQTVYLPKRHLERTLWEKITGIFDYSDEELDKKSAQARNATDNILNK